MTPSKILIVEDEENVRKLLQVYLQREGFLISFAADGEGALRKVKEWEPSLIVLDLMLPKLDGWEVCRRVRQQSGVPIIILSARGEEVDRIVGLELGADDYLPKPFSPRELIARIKAVLRRGEQTPVQEEKILTYPGLTVDSARRQAQVDGQVVPLTRREFDLLWHLASHPGQTLSREQLLQDVWGFDYLGESRTVDVHITRLRDKLEKPDGPIYIHTVWGVGYRFEVAQADEESV